MNHKAECLLLCTQWLANPIDLLSMRTLCKGFAKHIPFQYVDAESKAELMRDAQEVLAALNDSETTVALFDYGEHPPALLTECFLQFVRLVRAYWGNIEAYSAREKAQQYAHYNRLYGISLKPSPLSWQTCIVSFYTAREKLPSHVWVHEILSKHKNLSLRNSSHVSAALCLLGKAALCLLGKLRIAQKVFYRYRISHSAIYHLKLSYYTLEFTENVWVLYDTRIQSIAGNGTWRPELHRAPDGNFLEVSNGTWAPLRLFPVKDQSI